MSEQKTEATENSKATKKAKKKTSPKIKKPKSGKFSINRVFIVLNAIVLILLLYQIFSLFSSYSKKSEEMFEQGRIVSISPLNDTVKYQPLSDAEIAGKKLKYDEALKEVNKDNKPEDAEKVEQKAEDFNGPMPLKNAEDEAKLEEQDQVYGPMPLAKVEEKKPEEKKEEVAQEENAPLAPVDYNKANLAVIVVEIGMKQMDLEMIQSLPKEVSVAVSPYADELQKKIDFFVRDGRQALINLMLQSSSFPSKDNGPLSVQVSYDEPTINMKMTSALDIANGYIGAMAADDEVVTSKFDKLSAILKKLTERGLFFGYFKNASNLNVENDAKPLAADVFGVDYLIDENASEEAIKKQLEIVKEDLLVSNKRLVIAVRTYPNSINIIKDWLKKNRGNKIQLAPISYFVTNN
jgi:polysaccharide deacetylase 2 family uncharacterized protein YibQ